MKIFYSIIVLCCLSNHLFALTKYWVGTTGSYSNGANWNTQSNGSGTSGTPINTDDVVIDRNATITIDGTYFPSSVWIINNATVTFTNSSATAFTYTIGGGTVLPAFKIESGSTLNINGTRAITIAIGSGSTANIFGVLDVTGSSSKMDYSFGGGITTVKTGGKIRYGGASSGGTGSTSTFFMEAGSVYEIYKDGGSFPTGTYNANSLLLNSGAAASPASFSMNSSTGSYGNYEFNSPGYTNSSTGINNNYTFNNITITDDGSGSWVFSTNSLTAYTLTINGNLTIAAGTNFEINKAASGSQATTVSVKGDIINNGTITETNGNTGSLLEIAGTSTSSFSTVTNGITNDISLKINKTAGTAVIALTDITLPASAFSRLTLTSGNIDMQTNNKLLFIQNPAFTALIGGTANSHIIGKLKRSSNQVGGYSFPVSNNATQLAKATITTSSTNATDWTVEFIPVNANAGNGFTPGVIEVVSNYVWNITRTGATPSNADFLTLFYGGLNTSQVLIPAQVKVVHWNGIKWDNLGGLDGGGSVDNTLGSTGGAAPGDPITTFSPFTLGGVIGVIPISIEYFRGTKNNNDHVLSWKVNCTGSTNVSLIVERSADGRNFNNIYAETVSALRCRQPFTHADINPMPGLNYYRLKMIDTDGKIYYSTTIGLLNKQTGFEILSLSPNPVSDNGMTVLNISSAQKELVQFFITDMNGKKVYTQNGISLIAGSNQLPLQLSDLSGGAYQLTVISENGKKASSSFVKE